MDPSGPSLLSGLAQRLQFLSARASVISENIANADTPGFVARDATATGFRARLAAALRLTDPRHLAPARHDSPVARIEAAPDADVALNGNKVSIETQMMKMSETRADYQLVSTVYRKSVDMLKHAVRGGR